MIQVLYPTISLWLAAILILAAVHKLSDWPRFLAVMAAYDLVSDARLKFAGVFFIAAEICAAVLLVLMVDAGLSLAGFLFTTYLFAMAYNVVKGKSHIDCGCGDAPTRIGFYTLGRNFVLIIAAAIAGMLPAYEVTISSYAVGFCLSAIATLLYFGFEELSANKSRHERLWLGAS